MIGAIKPEVGRLALRIEGDMWAAYYALPDTMAAAYCVATIRYHFVAHPAYKARRAAFIEMAQGMVADLIEKEHGFRPVFEAETCTYD